MIPLAYYPQTFYRTSHHTIDHEKRKNRHSIYTYERLKDEKRNSEEMIEPSTGFMMHDILKCDIRRNIEGSREDRRGKCEETFGTQIRSSSENQTGELRYYRERAAKNTETRHFASQRYAEAEYMHSSSTDFYRNHRASTILAPTSRQFCKSDHAFFYPKNVSPLHYSPYRSWEYSNSPSFIYHSNSKSYFDFERTEGGKDKDLSSDSSQNSSPFTSYGFYSEYFDGKKKRTRTIFSKDQIAELEKAYTSCRYLTGALREEIANKLQMSSCQVKIWFQNKRNKEKREQKTNTEDSDDSKDQMTEGNEDTFQEEKSEKQQNINSN